MSYKNINPISLTGAKKWTKRIIRKSTRKGAFFIGIIQIRIFCGVFLSFSVLLLLFRVFSYQTHNGLR